MDKNNLTTSNCLWDIYEDENNCFDLHLPIMMSVEQDTDDGTYPLVLNYINCIKAIDKYGPQEYLNRISKRKLTFDFGYCLIKREDLYTSQIELIFKEKVNCIIGYINEKPIIKKVNRLVGEINVEYFFLKIGRQNKYANGFELIFNIKKLYKDKNE